MSHKLPHQWSIDHNPLSGITAGRWWRLLVENRFDVDIQYVHRAAFVSALSLFNSACATWEKLRYGKAISQVALRKDPIFILGHWRGGTTHLHNMLALDERLTAPTTFQAVNPSSFLSTLRILPTVFKPFLPARRPMDEMEMGFDMPQEDELALSLISGLSPYISLSFPRRAAHYNRFLTFEEASQEEVRQWKEAFTYFTRKLGVNETRRVVYKSPGHTARIKLILEMFPEARFIHIHRDPYVVFQSCRHYFQTAAWYANLQRIDTRSVDDAIFKRYQDLYDAYLSQRELIPKGRLHELSYESLVDDPLDEMQSLYSKLQIDTFSTVEPRLKRYLDRIATHRVNRHPALNEEELCRVASEWGKYFEAWGYPLHSSAAEAVEANDLIGREALR